MKAIEEGHLPWPSCVGPNTSLVQLKKEEKTDTPAQAQNSWNQVGRVHTSGVTSTIQKPTADLSTAQEKELASLLRCL